MNCKICNNNSSVLFETIVLNKYNVAYYKCDCCDFIQTEEAVWLNEAYSEAITKLDLGYATRNILSRDIVSSIIKCLFKGKASFLDYGGGYGLFVRLMRDWGYDFYHHDLYCKNLFSEHFSAEDSTCDKFELVTAFEVFEHLNSPMEEIDKMLSYSDSIFFSTELQPKSIKSADDWWYFSPDIGQHISFFSKKTLNVIAEIKKINVLSDNKSFHLLSKEKKNNIKFLSSVYKVRVKNKILGKYFDNKRSLLNSDYDKVKHLL